MRRKHRRREVHGRDWHEQMLAEPWLNYTNLRGETPRPLTPCEYEIELRRSREQMTMHDSQPKRVRELVGELGVSAGIQAYRDEHRARPKSERCSHGRFPESCPQCVWQAAQAARGLIPVAVARDGEALTRKTSGETVADILKRRGTWR